MEEETETGGIGPTKQEWLAAPYTKALLKEADKRTAEKLQVLLRVCSGASHPEVARAFNEWNKWAAMAKVFRTGGE